MKKTYTLIAAIAFTLAANAQTRAVSITTLLSPVGVPTFSADRTPTDTLVGFSWTNNSAAGPQLLGAQGGGFVCGNNGYGDKAKAQAFTNTLGSVAVDGALIWFGAKEHDGSAPATSKITVKEYSLDGPGENNTATITTAPGTVNATVDVLFAAIDTGSTYADGASAYMFATAPIAAGDFAIGVDFTTLGAGDTVGIVHSTDADAGTSDMSWEKWSDDTWHSLLKAWPLDIDLFIWALVEPSNGIEEQGFLNGARLSNNVPNPANQNTIVGYELQKNTDNVSLRIFDVTGKLVATYNEGNKIQGKHSINVETSNLDAGVYYYALTAGNGRIAKKMIVSK